MLREVSTSKIINKKPIIHQYAELNFGKLSDLELENIELSISEYSYRDRVDTPHLRIAISRLIIHKYHLKSDHVEIDLMSICEDQFLLDMIQSVPLIGKGIEELFTKLRHSLLLMLLESEEPPLYVCQLVSAMCVQNFLNDYVHFISQDETNLLKALRVSLELDTEKLDWSPKQSEVNLLSLALYQQLHDLPQKDHLTAFAITAWPESLQRVADIALFSIADEYDRAEEIQSITEIDDASMPIRHQYEQHPYPRWVNIPRLSGATFTYAQILANLLPSFEKIPEALHQTDFKILIAGCGTGKEAIELASVIPKAQITAIDISRRSLAYGVKKAEQFGINNIKFFHGDILKLDTIQRQFDLIISAGVLHHLKDPLKGWENLRQLLAPRGIMQIHLYSEIARQHINYHRQRFFQSNLPTNDDTMRQYRRHLIENDDPIIKLLDFWTMSECRDLLFHCQEHQFTWPKIQSSCDQLGLKMIGVAAKKPVRDLYGQYFPDDQQMNNFKNWDRLEQKHPNLFIDMYAFYCMRADH